MSKTEQAIGFFPGIHLQVPAFLLLILASVAVVAQSSFQICSEKFESKQYDSALACMKQLTIDTVSGKEEFYNLGLCNYQMKNYPEAIRCFDTCLVIDSNFKEAAWMLALTFQNSGNWKKAVTTYQMLNTSTVGITTQKNVSFITGYPY